MKPYAICHMVCSVDGRTLHSRWRPKSYDVGDLFERLHDKLGGDAWIVGRTTGQEFAKADDYQLHTDQTFPRENWFVRRDAGVYGIVLDADGKIAWGRSDIDGDPIVVVLTEKVSDAHLAGLRSDGVSYIFAGKTEVNLDAALETLNAELGVERLLVEGGGTANGAFLRAGLLDELSMVICPAIDGASGAPSLFHSTDADADAPAPLTSMKLESSEILPGGEVWLRYRLEGV